MYVRWVGPYKIIDTKEHSFIIEDLINGKHITVHQSRLKFYSDDQLNINDEILEYISNQGLDLIIQNILDHRYNESLKRYEFLVKWEGLETFENSWESLTRLIKDVKKQVLLYSKQCNDKQFIKVVNGY